MFVETWPLTMNSGWSYCRKDGLLFTLMWATFCAGHSGLKEMRLQRKALCLNLLCFGHFSTHGLLERHFISVKTCLIYYADHTSTLTAGLALSFLVQYLSTYSTYLVQAHRVIAWCCAAQESWCHNKLFMFKAERRVLVLWPWVLNYSETGFHAGWKCCREHAKQLNKALYGCFCSG